MQAALMKRLEGLYFRVVYLDDILVYSSGELDIQLVLVGKVFDRLEASSRCQSEKLKVIVGASEFAV